MQAPRPEEIINPGYFNPNNNPNKRKLEDDSNTTRPPKRSKRVPTRDSRTVQPIGSNSIVRAKTTLVSLPPETILEIFKYTNRISGACLALTCKYLFKNGEKFKVSCPPVKGRYSQDRDRLQFMKLLKNWMPEGYRLCWMCRKYKPINGGALVLYEREGTPIKKKTATPVGCKYEKFKDEWKDDDWTFMSLGACKSKQRKIETRTYCPKCTVACHNVSLI